MVRDIPIDKSGVTLSGNVLLRMMDDIQNFLLGFVFLRERLRLVQGFCVFLAAVGVAILWQRTGGLPLISLFLAFNFAVYGLLRKTAKVDAVIGLATEITVLTPLALDRLVVSINPPAVPLRAISVRFTIPTILSR